jgi:hypothetical protein
VCFFFQFFSFLPVNTTTLSLSIFSIHVWVERERRLLRFHRSRVDTTTKRSLFFFLFRLLLLLRGTRTRHLRVFSAQRHRGRRTDRVG